MTAETRDYVIAARRRLGLSREELAAGLMVSPRTIAAYEATPEGCNHRNLPPWHRDRIARMLAEKPAEPTAE